MSQQGTSANVIKYYVYVWQKLWKSKRRRDQSYWLSKDISDKRLLGEWFIEEPYAFIMYVRFCEGLLRLEPLIVKK